MHLSWHFIVYFNCHSEEEYNDDEESYALHLRSFTFVQDDKRLTFYCISQLSFWGIAEESCVSYNSTPKILHIRSEWQTVDINSLIINN